MTEQFDSRPDVERRRKLEEALADVLGWVDHSRIFITTRERMHETGVTLVDESAAAARKLLENKP